MRKKVIQPKQEVARSCILKSKGNVSTGLNDILETIRVGFEGHLPYSQNGKLFCESQDVQLGFNYGFESSNF